MLGRYRNRQALLALDLRFPNVDLKLLGIAPKPFGVLVRVIGQAFGRACLGLAPLPSFCLRCRASEDDIGPAGPDGGH